MFEILAIDKSKNTTVVVDGVAAVVMDRHSNPIALVQALGQDQTTVITVDDPSFHIRLKQFGIDKTVIVDRHVIKQSAG